jgi:glycosyltransferase involved in cell wall biosynthesis
MVSVFCVTYNHEGYIAETIDGFLSQVTDFAFEIIIGEDCSKDRTLEIVNDYAERYPNLIKVISGPQNVGPGENFNRTLNAAQGKYVAYCEGDDYWIDPYKLKKQVDFLEQHSDYGMVFTDTKIFREKTSFLQNGWSLYKSKKWCTSDFPKVLFSQNPISSCTICVRKDVFVQANINVNIHKKWSMLGDLQLWIYIAIKSKIYHLNEATAVYRIRADSASKSSSLKNRVRFRNEAVAIRQWFIKTYNLENSLYSLALKTHIKELYKLAFEFSSKELVKRIESDYPNHTRSFKELLFVSGSKNSIASIFVKKLLHFYPIFYLVIQKLCK